MIKVNIDLHKHGNDRNPKPIGTIKIWNDLTGTEELGNYRYEIRTTDELFLGTIAHFNRNLSIFDLLLEVLQNHHNNEHER